MAFAYSAGVGTNSVMNIIALARQSGIPFNVTSTVRSAPQPGQRADFHMTGNAVDMAASPENMVKLAQWFSKMAPYELELIHSGGGGFFVKNGAVVGADFYGPSIVAQHYNHVHVAMTNDGINATKSVLSGGIPIPNPIDALNNAGDGIAAIKKILSEGAAFFKLLVNPDTYLRIGLIIVGMAMLVVGFIAIAKSSALPDQIKNAIPKAGQ